MLQGTGQCAMSQGRHAWLVVQQAFAIVLSLLAGIARLLCICWGGSCTCVYVDSISRAGQARMAFTAACVSVAVVFL